MPVGRQEDRDGRELWLPVGTKVELSSEGGRNWAASVKHEQCLSFPDMGALAREAVGPHTWTSEKS